MSRFGLFVFVGSTLAFLRGFKRALSLVSAGLFAYGEYSVIAEGSGYLLYEAIESLLTGPVIIALSAVKGTRAWQKIKELPRHSSFSLASWSYPPHA